MKPLPEILITGFPNSGTSFLCNLIVALGKSPGSSRDLKKGDSHNRYGYFENLKMREITYKALGHDYFKFWEKELIDQHPIFFSPEKLTEYSQKIIGTAQKDNIEVYKDNIIPLIFRIFPKESKFINIKRDPKKCYESPRKGGHSEIPCSFEEFLDAYNKYQELVKQMAKEVRCFQVNYEDFYDNFDEALTKITEFIGVEVNPEKLDALKKVFKPRKSLIQKLFFSK